MKWAYILVVAPGYNKLEMGTLLTFTPAAMLPFELPGKESAALVFFPVSAFKVVVGTTEVLANSGVRKRNKLQTAHMNSRKLPPERQHGSAEASGAAPCVGGQWADSSEALVHLD
jgi:hypothetical protein